MNVLPNTWRHAVCALSALSLFATLPAHAGISQLPLALAKPTAPNVMFTLDDSGSMMFEITPEGLSPNGTETNGTSSAGGWLTYTFPLPPGGRVYSTNGSYYSGWLAGVVNFNATSLAAARYRTAALNVSYYDPDYTYRPWYSPAGTLANADPTRAYYNPMLPANGAINLTTQQYTRAYWLDDNGRGIRDRAASFFPALYYRFDPTRKSCNGSNRNLQCFQRFEIRPGNTYPHNGHRSDCNAKTQCTYEEEIQNFANWFQYYRSRILMTRAAVGSAFSKQGEAIRVGFTTINDTTPAGYGRFTGIRRPLAPFDAANRTAFYQDFYRLDLIAKGTPLMQAMATVGDYFRNNAEPWADRPGDRESACRASYQIFTTDGYYGDGTYVGDVDSTKGQPMTAADGTTYQYKPTRPYADGIANTLADVAMKYWVNDLRPATNLVPTNTRDPAFWQHLVTNTLAIGVSGELQSNPGNQGIKQAELLKRIADGSVSWPNPQTSGNAEAKIDDLWHAAVNTRGDSFAANDPAGLTAAMTTMLNRIAERTASSSAASTNDTAISTGTTLYLARYRAGNWSGELLSLGYDPATRNFTRENWNAARQIPLPPERNILTWRQWDGKGAGTPFKWDDRDDISLSPGQKAALDNDRELVAYLRGETRGEERNGGSFRDRLAIDGTGKSVSNVLGDIVNSTPVYVGAADDRGYGNLAGAGGSSYAAFVAANRTTRPDMIYVGANDGMLHGFDARNGVERLAYVPNQAIVGTNGMRLLASPGYGHRFFVDAVPVVSDAWLPNATPGAGWKTVLVSGMGAGGRGMFALDVTRPNRFGARDIMWELSGDQDADLGYTLGIPVIGRVNDGRWVAIFGNGYESASGRAVLYIVNLANPFGTGGIRKIVADPEEKGSGYANGLGSPEVVYDANLTIQTVYAGDLKGRLWKFDLAGANPSAWGARHGGIEGAPLFTARSAAGVPQPITAAPTAVVNTADPARGLLLTFGTGRFYDTADVQPIGEQSLYGVSDRAPPGATRALLQQQTMTPRFDATTSSRTFTLSRNTVDYRTRYGWYIDLPTTGERVVVKPKIEAERTVITTLIPSADSCSGGIRSGLYEFAALSGGATTYSVLDVNRDNKIDSADTIRVGNEKQVVSGIERAGNQGVAILTGKEGGLVKVSVTSAGDPETMVGQSGSTHHRLTWRQIAP